MQLRVLYNNFEVFKDMNYSSLIDLTSQRSGNCFAVPAGRMKQKWKPRFRKWCEIDTQIQPQLLALRCCGSHSSWVFRAFQEGREDQKDLVFCCEERKEGCWEIPIIGLMVQGRRAAESSHTDTGDTKELGSSSRRSQEQLPKHSQPEVIFLLWILGRWSQLSSSFKSRPRRNKT